MKTSSIDSKIISAITFCIKCNIKARPGDRRTFFRHRVFKEMALTVYQKIQLETDRPTGRIRARVAAKRRKTRGDISTLQVVEPNKVAFHIDILPFYLRFLKICASSMVAKQQPTANFKEFGSKAKLDIGVNKFRGRQVVP